MMSHIPYFERLVETAELVVRHADYPGKGAMLEHCRREVEDLTEAGQISIAQGEMLREILQGKCPREASAPALW